jgi:C-terminal peptidase prc
VVFFKRARGTYRRSETLLLLSVPGFLLLNFSLLYALKQHTRVVTSETPISSESPLSCGQVYQVGVWSKGRYGGPRHLDVRAPKFSKKLAQVFLERLDPFKVLFSDAEVHEFEAGANQGWGRVINAKDCSYFEGWLQQKYGNARERFFQRLSALPLKFTVGTKAQDLVSLREKAPKYKTYAKEETQLRDRLSLLIQKVAAYSSVRVLAAYHHDKRQFINDTLNQLIFSEIPTPNHLLAKAMLGALDPYSTYFSSVEFEDFYQDLSGGTSGIGVKVRKVPEGLMIEKLMKDSPAERAKRLKPGDTITAVNGVRLADLSVSACRKLLKGKEESDLTLTIHPMNVSQRSFVLTLKRESIVYEDARISHRFLTPRGKSGQRVAVIEIPSFYGRGGLNLGPEDRSSAEDLEKIVTKIVKGKEKTSAIVLDVRGNPGGFLEEAVSMAGLFLGERPVVGVVERDGRRVLRDHRKAIYQGPLVVLLDGGSASASEVLAGALKDHQRAILVGDGSSYGKGSVQRLFHLDDEFSLLRWGNDPWSGIVKLTTSLFYSPLGHSPANGGIEPHIVVSEGSKPEYDDRPALKVAESEVPEVPPFLDNSELGELRNKEARLQAKVTTLQSLSSQRIALLTKALTHEDQSVGDSEEDDQRVVDEGVEVAADYVALDQKSRRTRFHPVLRRNSSVRNGRRDVVGY